MSAAFLVSGFLVAVGLFGFTASAIWGSATVPLVPATLLQSATGLLAFGLATWVFGVRMMGLTAADLRWHPGGMRGLVVALGLGVGAAAMAMLLAVPLAGARWALDGGSLVRWGITVLGTSALLLPAAFLEELIFRGVPQVLLGRVVGRATAVLVLSGCFALAHLWNPGISALALGNIALAGVFLGAAFFLPGGLWAATAAHLGWNVTLAALAAPVSGLPFRMPWLDYRPAGPAWLSGSAFGPEGGVLATGVLLAVTLLTVRLVQRPAGA